MSTVSLRGSAATRQRQHLYSPSFSLHNILLLGQPLASCSRLTLLQADLPSPEPPTPQVHQAADALRAPCAPVHPGKESSPLRHPNHGTYADESVAQEAPGPGPARDLPSPTRFSGGPIEPHISPNWVINRNTSLPLNLPNCDAHVLGIFTNLIYLQLSDSRPFRCILW